MVATTAQPKEGENKKSFQPSGLTAFKCRCRLDTGKEKEQAPYWADATIEPLVSSCHTTHFSPSSVFSAELHIVTVEPPGTSDSKRSRQAGDNVPSPQTFQKRKDTNILMGRAVWWTVVLGYASLALCVCEEKRDSQFAICWQSKNHYSKKKTLNNIHFCCCKAY